MPELENVRHEKFAELVAVGVPPYRAGLQAGFGDHSASNLMKRDDIRARVSELCAEHRERCEVTID